MTDAIDETNLVEEKVQKIMRQTNYSKDECREKLEKHNGDEILVIKEYFGIINKKDTPIKSINQEIYKQIRSRLASSLIDK
jgi:hypothetical protein